MSSFHERKSGWLMLVAAACVVMCMVFTIIYTKHVVAESEKRDCESIAADVYAYKEAPPSTETGWRQWNSKTKRYNEMKCSPALPIPVRSKVQ